MEGSESEFESLQILPDPDPDTQPCPHEIQTFPPRACANNKPTKQDPSEVKG
jgi:hypothetical protein